MHGEQFRVTLDLPPMAVMFFKIKNKRTPPSQLPAGEAVPENVSAEEVPAEAAIPVTLPLLDEERPVADFPEEPEKPAKQVKPIKPESPAKPAKPEEKSPEVPAKPAEKADTHTNPAKKGDNPNKITTQKVGTGGNI